MRCSSVVAIGAPAFPRRAWTHYRHIQEISHAAVHGVPARTVRANQLLA